MPPTLDKISIYPLKSFDPIHVPESRILTNGALQYDRQFAFVDAAGKFVNAKRTALIHPLHVILDPVARTLTARKRSDSTSMKWEIDSERSSLEEWFSEYFSMSVSLQEHNAGGFPDDDEAPGPTIVSTTTLQVVGAWFPGFTVEQTRLRFRANLEIAGVDPFWEDCLYCASAGIARPFRIGDLLLTGTNPCQRCVVPSRDPATGEILPEFAKRFSQLRAEHLPRWASRDRFDHFYRLTVNTKLISHGSGRIKVGDTVELLVQ